MVDLGYMEVFFFDIVGFCCLFCKFVGIREGKGFGVLFLKILLVILRDDGDFNCIVMI